VIRLKTNGHAVKEPVARRIREEIDPFLVEVSIHGASGATHDRQTRVDGSFERLVANIRTMKSLGLRVKANSVLTRWNEHEVEDMLEAMGALEAMCGELACARATDAEIAAIRRTHERMTKAYERRDRLAYFRLNQEIHHRVAQASRNATLQRLHATLNARLYRVRFMSNKTDRWHTAVEEHEAIADALERRDVPAVRRLLREHLGHTWKKVKAHGY